MVEHSIPREHTALPGWIHTAATDPFPRPELILQAGLARSGCPTDRRLAVRRRTRSSGDARHRPGTAQRLSRKAMKLVLGGGRPEPATTTIRFTSPFR